MLSIARWNEVRSQFGRISGEISEDRNQNLENLSFKEWFSIKKIMFKIHFWSRFFKNLMRMPLDDPVV